MKTYRMKTEINKKFVSTDTLNPLKAAYSASMLIIFDEKDSLMATKSEAIQLRNFLNQLELGDK
jgi:hypothetical protein